MNASVRPRPSEEDAKPRVRAGAWTEVLEEPELWNPTPANVWQQLAARTLRPQSQGVKVL